VRQLPEVADDAPTSLRRFLKKLGVNTYKRAITASLFESIGDQTPVQWWRNATSGASAASDIRSVNEGLSLAMCLEAENNVQFMREVVCRRLMGLHFVVRATGADRTAEWARASALLPLNPLSSVNIDIDKMVDKEAKRSSRSTASYSRSSSSSSFYSNPLHRGRSQRFRRFGDRNSGRFSRPSYTADNDGGYAGPSSFRRGGGNGRRSYQSGAPSALSHRGSFAAGGSGATPQ
jgi:hypothetical protein